MATILYMIFIAYAIGIVIALFFQSTAKSLRMLLGLLGLCSLILSAISIWNWIYVDHFDRIEQELLGDAYRSSFRREVVPILMGMGGIWLAGLLGCLVSKRRIKRRDQSIAKRRVNPGMVTAILGTIWLLILLAGRVERFYEGVAFEKSGPGFYFFLPALFIFLGFFPYAITTLISVFRKRTSPKWLLALLLPILWHYSYDIPIPTFAEGMAHRMNRDFEAAYFHDFARDARLLLQGKGTAWQSGSTLSELEHKFPEIMNIAGAPEVQIQASHVNILWGSILTNHWGIRILLDHDQTPFESAEQASTSKAFEGVYSYHLPY